MARRAFFVAGAIASIGLVGCEQPHPEPCLSATVIPPDGATSPEGADAAATAEPTGTAVQPATPSAPDAGASASDAGATDAGRGATDAGRPDGGKPVPQPCLKVMPPQNPPQPCLSVVKPPDK